MQQIHGQQDKVYKMVITKMINKGKMNNKKFLTLFVVFAFVILINSFFVSADKIIKIIPNTAHEVDPLNENDVKNNIGVKLTQDCSQISEINVDGKVIPIPSESDNTLLPAMLFFNASDEKYGVKIGKYKLLSGYAGYNALPLREIMLGCNQFVSKQDAGKSFGSAEFWQIMTVTGMGDKIALAAFIVGPILLTKWITIGVVSLLDPNAFQDHPPGQVLRKLGNKESCPQGKIMLGISYIEGLFDNKLGEFIIFIFCKENIEILSL